MFGVNLLLFLLVSLDFFEYMVYNFKQNSIRSKMLMKLFVSDLDGTLLRKNETNLNKKTKSIIHSVLEKGNKFAIASGRSYVELKGLFNEFEKDIYFICSDGGLGVYKEKNFFQNAIDHNLITGFDDFIAHGKYMLYIKSSKKMLIRETMKKYRGHVMTIDSASEIPSEIFKVTNLGQKADCPLSLVYKDNTMSDYIAHGTDKSVAVEFLYKSLGIPKENTIAFGDNVNDIEMMKICGTAYAVANALPKVKKIADKITTDIEATIFSLI